MSAESQPSSPLHLLARQRQLKDSRCYELLVHIFVVILLISNLVAPKICQLGPFKVSGALLLFPITYIFGDIFTEVYGYAASRRAIWNGFFASALLAGISMIVVALPPSPDWHFQHEYEVVLGFVPRIIVASLIAYWFGEFANSFVMARMKVWTNGKHLWTRTVGSTVVGQGVDTILVMVLAFGGTMSNSDVFRAIVSGYTAKVLYEVVMT